MTWCSAISSEMLSGELVTKCMSPVVHETIRKGNTTFVDGIPPDSKAHSAALTSPWSLVASARWPCLYKSCSLRIIRGKKLAMPVMTPCAPTASAPLG